MTDNRCCNFATSVVVDATLVGGWLHFKFKFELNTVCYTCFLDMQRQIFSFLFVSLCATYFSKYEEAEICR